VQIDTERAWRSALRPLLCPFQSLKKVFHLQLAAVMFGWKSTTNPASTKRKKPPRHLKGKAAA